MFEYIKSLLSWFMILTALMYSFRKIYLANFLVGAANFDDQTELQILIKL